MNELIYLYVPRGYTPGYAYRRFEDAVAHLLKDERHDSLEALSETLGDWWHDFDVENCSISIDDGARIEEIELR